VAVYKQISPTIVSMRIITLFLLLDCQFYFFLHDTCLFHTVTQFGWDAVGGLSIWINDRKVAYSTHFSARALGDSSFSDREQFYFGRGDGSRANARNGNFAIDDVEYWYSNRDFLIAFGYIQRGS